MARVSLSTAERSMFLRVHVRTVSDASGLCKCSIKVSFVLWEPTVKNDNNNDILIHFLQRRRRVVSLSKTLYSPKVLVNYPGSGGSVPT